MTDKQQIAQNGTPWAGIVFLIFMTLKLTGHITWSWWWVTAPLWGTAAAILALAAFIVFFSFVRTWLE